ncbi:MAG: Holliday junction branch migration protein RuvA, partial [Defluviitaleaceae bacterium]|nr:Holliday junction branch migration protein RuvA [Defluviitaleaceae bacterium]
MIAYIKGTVDQLNDQSVVLDNQGIGYIVNASAATLSRLPRKGETAQIYTYLQVKEDDMSLFGFISQEEIELFRLLISISGIGPKVGMAILATLSPAQIMTAIVSEDAIAFSKVPGVGKKTAQRITLELQDKIKSLGL